MSEQLSVKKLFSQRITCQRVRNPPGRSGQAQRRDRGFFLNDVTDYPSWIISSCGFESSWYPLDVTRTSCSRLQVPNLLVTEGSMVKTISFCTSFSPCLPYLLGHLGPSRGPIS